jgi:hypothetical protein
MVSLAATADSTDESTLSAYAPRGLDIVDATGQLVEHLGPERGRIDDQWFGAIAEEIRSRVRVQPPLLGVSKRGHVILRGFVAPPEDPVEIIDAVDTVDDSNALENPNDVCDN